MIKAYRLFTGPDGHSHVEQGSIISDVLLKADSIQFKQTPAYSSKEWHNAPSPQYVLTLAGVISFSTRGGETFTVYPGDVLLVLDEVGSGHRWRLIGDEPWKRVCIIVSPATGTCFVAGAE